MRLNWRGSLGKFCRLKVSVFVPVAVSVIFLLVYAKCNFASVFIFDVQFGVNDGLKINSCLFL